MKTTRKEYIVASTLLECLEEYYLEEIPKSIKSLESKLKRIKKAHSLIQQEIKQAKVTTKRFDEDLSEEEIYLLCDQYEKEIQKKLECFKRLVWRCDM